MPDMGFTLLQQQLLTFGLLLLGIRTSEASTGHLARAGTALLDARRAVDVALFFLCLIKNP